MAARDEQQQIGKVEVRIGQPRAQRMAFEMIDGDQRLARGERQPLAGEQRDHHAADQPGPGGRRDRVDSRDRQLGVVEHLPDQAGQDLDMGARGDLRHHAAIGLVRAFWPTTACARMRRSLVTSAAALSSHEDSRPRIQRSFRAGPLPDPRAMH